MSKERDIDDILESLNQLLREGESHNDDHVEEDISIEEIAVKLHELDEEINELEGAPVLSDAPAETVDEPTPESWPEPDAESVQEQDENDNSDRYSDAEEDEEPVDSPISIQRVVLTEEMLVNNPQGNLLTRSYNHNPPSAEADKVAVEPAIEGRTVSEEQESGQYERAGEVPRTQLDVDHPHLEQLLKRVTDDVMHHLQQELPVLIRRSLYHHLAQMSKEQNDEGHEENSEE